METINLKEFASTLQALRSCIASNNQNTNDDGKLWTDVWQDRLDAMIEVLPHGSGFDRGVKLNEDKSNPERLVFDFSYTHYTEGGYMDGETEHELIITPSFQGYKLRITGKNKNFTKEYFYDVFYEIFE